MRALLQLAAHAALALGPSPAFERALPWGLPSDGQLLAREGYVLSHDNWLKIPRWVAYRVEKEALRGGPGRSDDFRPDPELKPFQRAELADYKRSGYDRGHLAPAADMKVSTTSMSESFLLSNMAPQVGPGFNRGIWKDLEEKVRRWARGPSTYYVIAGPAFDDVDGDGVMAFKLIGPGRVAVPTHFFKIVISDDGTDDLGAIAFLFPNESIAGARLADFLAPIDRIERLTGLDFLHALPDEFEGELESSVHGRRAAAFEGL